MQRLFAAHRKVLAVFIILSGLVVLIAVLGITCPMTAEERRAVCRLSVIMALVVAVSGAGTVFPAAAMTVFVIAGWIVGVTATIACIVGMAIVACHIWSIAYGR